MINRRKQIGVGLIEVLVALLILAVGVLGFVALQYRAIEAISEGANRVQAINLARDLAEKIRVNREEIAVYRSSIQDGYDELSDTPAVDATENTPAQEAVINDCFVNFCSARKKAEFDSALAVLAARRVGMTVNMFACPDVNNGRSCIYVAWGDTSATNADGLNNCTTAGAYRDESTCVVMEAF